MEFDAITKEFLAFCDGKPWGISTEQFAYIGHCLHKCQQANPEHPDTSGHPLFMVWSLERSPKDVIRFLNALIEREKGKGESNADDVRI